MSQATEFKNGEGDAWYERNRNTGLNFTIINTILDIPVKPASILEVGCGNGRYLGVLHRHFGGRAVGFDPSGKAIQEARKNYPDIEFYSEEAAEGLNTEVSFKRNYDLILFGFCLYLIDREDLFYIVAASDAILNEGGHIAIHDFEKLIPQKVPYHHKEGIFTYKMHYPGLWLANPNYKLVSRVMTNDEEAITIIRKNKW